MIHRRTRGWTVDLSSVGGVVGASTTEPGADVKTASKYTLGAGLTVSHLEAFVDGAGSGTGVSKIKLGIYSDSAGPAALLVESSEILIADGQAAGWVGSDITPQSLSATTYWFAVIGDNSNYRVYMTAGAAGDEQYNADTYAGGFADPFGSPTSGSSQLAIRGLNSASVSDVGVTLAPARRPATRSTLNPPSSLALFYPPRRRIGRGSGW